MRHPAVTWAYVAAWLGTLAAMLGVLALQPPADRSGLITPLVPSLVTLLAGAGLWLTNRRTRQSVDQVAQTVEHNGNGDLTKQIRAAVAAELDARGVRRGQP